MNAHPRNITAASTNLWPCADCGRLRAYPYARMHTLFAGPYVACSCGDAAIDDSAAGAAARAAALRYLIHNNLL